MDRSWIELSGSDRFCKEYSDGVKSFIQFAVNSADSRNWIRCPCPVCNNVYLHSISIVEDHLFENGFISDYTVWIHHGETYDLNIDDGDNNDEHNDEESSLYANDGMQDMIENIYAGSLLRHPSEREVGSSEPILEGEVSEPIPDAEEIKFNRLLEDAKREAYPGCQNYSKISCLVRLLHLKTMNNWTNKSWNQLIDFLKDLLPPGETLPKSYNEAKSMMRDLGLSYNKIHACKNDCILFRKEYSDLDACPKCGESRWEPGPLVQGKKVPQKVLRHFPLKPRLQRLFMSKQIAEDMRWHKEKRVEEDNFCRHPADSEAWKELDKNFKLFAKDPRNIRLGLATDGFNPFGNLSTSYSMWPVVLTPYNLPPWKCMKEPFLILSLLIPGKASPGNDIDVYLEPLIEELNELWEEGIDTFDAYSGETFKLHAAILWTISDFPAYAMLSGWSTKGKLACPNCNEETFSTTLVHGRKQCYRGHRRFLPGDHKWRRSRKFDGTVERRTKPRELSGDDVLEQLEKIPLNEFGKTQNTRKRKRNDTDLNWRKRSIFFNLPYWRTLKIRHNIDVMHVEKNICESILCTLMNVDGKSKDNVKARLDLQSMGLRKELHLQEVGDSFTMQLGCYTLDSRERKQFCEWLNTVKFPDGYASNIIRCVVSGGSKLSGMKSHDCHVFLQRLLPTAMRGHLRKDVYEALAELSAFFKELCSRTLRMDKIEKLEEEIVIILCKLEMIYPPAFFDIMIHLAVHLPQEAKIAGPVQYRWMYPIERFLRTLKCYVRNKARPEGSIAEAYINNECLTFCSLYLSGVESKFNREERNEDGSQGNGFLDVFSQKVRPLGAGKPISLEMADYEKVRWFVLNNSPELGPYMELHKDVLKRVSSHNLQQRHEESFSQWFEDHITKLRSQGSSEVTEDLYSLACGPDPRAERYYGCIVNGIRFHTKDHERTRKTQNSGVVTVGEHKSMDINFYGSLRDIIQLDYIGDRHVYLFQCDWFDVGDRRMGIQTDEYLTSVNVSRTWYAGDPYILASQAEQAFYLDDMKLGRDWKVVQKIQPRAVYDVPEVELDKGVRLEDDPVGDEEVYQQNDPCNEIHARDEVGNYSSVHKDGSAPITIDADTVRLARGNQSYGAGLIIDQEDEDGDEEEVLDNEEEDEEKEADEEDESDGDLEY